MDRWWFVQSSVKRKIGIFLLMLFSKSWRWKPWKYATRNQNGFSLGSLRKSKLTNKTNWNVGVQLLSANYHGFPITQVKRFLLTHNIRSVTVFFEWNYLWVAFSPYEYDWLLSNERFIRLWYYLNSAHSKQIANQSICRAR